MLTVTTTVSFAGLWLVPRLNDFRRLHPGIDMRLAATNEIQDLEREGIDLAIRYCTPKTAGRSALRLFGELVFPVCSKSALAGRKLKSPQDLSDHVLLHYDDPERRYPWLSWDVWFELTQTQGVKPAGTLRFSHYDQLVQAAIVKLAQPFRQQLGEARQADLAVRKALYVLARRFARLFHRLPAGCGASRGRRILPLAAAAGAGRRRGGGARGAA